METSKPANGAEPEQHTYTVLGVVEAILVF